MPHVEGWKGCRCAECRGAKGGSVKGVEGGTDRGGAGEVEIDPELFGVEVPEGWMLQSEVATKAGVTEERVEIKAKSYQAHSRWHRLGDGRPVVRKEWVEARLSIVKEG